MQKRIAPALIIYGVLTSLMLQPALAEKEPGDEAPAQQSVLTESETNDLLLMREEEKLARDVYHAMHKLYGQRVFSNIPRAEQRHMDAILNLLNTYGLEDPVQTADAGVFSHPELQKLYDTFVAQGGESKENAFLVGAWVEEVDIEDLIRAMERTDKADLLAVYGNLLSGSERHLNAFVRNYEAISGETYMAQKLTQEKVAEILGR